MFIALTIIILFVNIRKKEKYFKQKKYEFECGFNSINKNRLPFSTQFFLITILFLIFDLEIAIILPVSLEERKEKNSINLMFIILIVLTVGLIIE